MFKITTTYSTKTNGAGKITAKGHGKQRTVSYDPALSSDANHGAALGTLLDVLVSDEQRAKILHPTGRQRVSESNKPGPSRVWTINV